MRIDPHTHSTASDGTDEPAEVVRVAAHAGLDAIGLADHDTTAGWAEASREAEAAGLAFIPAVEVSTRHGGSSIHVLALWPREDADFLSMLKKTRTARVDRAKQIVLRLAEDYDLEWERVALRALNAETIGRPHIADALVDLGVVPHRDAAFAELLATRSRYYVPHYAPEVEEAIAVIRSVGGVPILAHPGAEGRTFVSDDLVATLAGCGLVGLEVDHRDHSEAQRERLSRLADRLGLVRTGGSDYHGSGKQNRLGENLTSEASYGALLEARG
jgi:predicted metal-dependent phosphoesterase TrpH